MLQASNALPLMTTASGTFVRQCQVRQKLVHLIMTGQKHKKVIHKTHDVPIIIFSKKLLLQYTYSRSEEDPDLTPRRFSILMFVVLIGTKG